PICNQSEYCCLHRGTEPQPNRLPPRLLQSRQKVWTCRSIHQYSKDRPCPGKTRHPRKRWIPPSKQTSELPPCCSRPARPHCHTNPASTAHSPHCESNLPLLRRNRSYSNPQSSEPSKRQRSGLFQSLSLQECWWLEPWSPHRTWLPQ